jgi:hypothetical protein
MRRLFLANTQRKKGMTKVHTLLYCRSSKDEEGNFLFFKTLRTGFPNCEINVYSNANSKSFNQIAKAFALKVDANFIELPQEIEHCNFIGYFLTNEKEPFYVIDPDTIWFDEMPTEFPADIAGRYIPNFHDKYSNSNTYERLHTSCLYLNPSSIQDRISTHEFHHEFDYIRPSIFYYQNKCYRHDTCSKLYGFLKNTNTALAFNEELNNKFAHLFCGTHLSQVSQDYPELEQQYVMCKENPEQAKVFFQKQQKFFLQTPWK